MQPLTRLYEREQYAFKLKHPLNPFITIPKVSKPDTANGITNCIKRWCSAHGYFAERINTTGIPRTTPTGVKWTRSGSTTGSADIHVIVRNSSGEIMPLKIEVKAGKDQLRDAQIKYAQKAVLSIYLVVHSFAEFLTWWDQNGILDNLTITDTTPIELPTEHVQLQDQTTRTRQIEAPSDSVIGAVLKMREMDKTEPIK